MTCAFFGHKETPSSIKHLLEEEIRRMIEDEGCDNFLVGNQGQFDAMVYSVLKQLRSDYPFIRCGVILAYLPSEKDEYAVIDPLDTVYPEGLEAVPKRFAISHRNRWIVDNADAVICYITHTYGGAYQAVSLAERKKLPIINLAGI